MEDRYSDWAKEMKEEKNIGAMYYEKSEITPVFVVGYAISVKKYIIGIITVSVSAWDEAFGFLLKETFHGLICQGDA